jgi:hypothetical protein
MINDSYKTEYKINCEFIVDENKQKVEISSTNIIESGNELFISYGDTYLLIFKIIKKHSINLYLVKI